MIRRGWWPDLLLALAAVGMAVSSARLSLPESPERGQTTLLGILAGAALVAVRRYPWPVLLAEAAVFVYATLAVPYGTGLPLLAGTVALACVSFRHGWRAALLGWGLSYAIFVFAIARVSAESPLAGPRGVLRLVLVGALVATPVIFGQYLRGVRTAARVAEERAREAEARRAVETRAARLAERAGVARDLHDIVAHHIAAVALRASTARYAARHTGRVDEAVEALGDIRDTAARVLDELRELLAVLRDPEAISDAVPMIEPEQIMAEAERLTRAAGLDVQVTGAGGMARLPLVLRTTVARVVQEGLANSLKHAGPGAVVTVEIQPDDRAIRVEVRDSGPDRPVPAAGLPPSGHGLTGLRERVGLLGGSLVVGPAGAGWRLLAHLPIRENA
ncbi:sensor histidine kinase [Plantactinospora siamensis]|uniref:histidine kinase n=1 Tax=Plantactinospora siamensis TaxID=555372 RepID=A0ABV6NZQ1_9ACTN